MAKRWLMGLITEPPGKSSFFRFWRVPFWVATSSRRFVPWWYLGCERFWHPRALYLDCLLLRTVSLGRLIDDDNLASVLTAAPTKVKSPISLFLPTFSAPFSLFMIVTTKAMRSWMCNTVYVIFEKCRGDDGTFSTIWRTWFSKLTNLICRQSPFWRELEAWLPVEFLPSRFRWSPFGWSKRSPHLSQTQKYPLWRPVMMVGSRF